MQIRDNLAKVLCRPKRAVVAAVETPVALKNYYNLDPSLEHISGLSPAILPRENWLALCQFCASHGIVQADLEKLYHHFACLIESSERVFTTHDRIKQNRKVCL